MNGFKKKEHAYFNWQHLCVFYIIVFSKPKHLLYAAPMHKSTASVY